MRKLKILAIILSVALIVLIIGSFIWYLREIKKSIKISEGMERVVPGQKVQ